VRTILVLLALAAAPAWAQETSETRELIGRMGRSTAILVLTSTQRADGDWRVTGEYLLVPSFQRRYLEGERSPQLGVMTLREGATPILFGRPPTGTLQGTWRDGKFAGIRLAPGGQERDRFEFAEEFPAMDDYSAKVRCEAKEEPRYASTLAYTVEAGRLRRGSFEWHAKLSPSGHTCAIGSRNTLAQVVMVGGLRFKAGNCAVTLRDIGDYVRASAEDCAAFCGSQAYFEPVLIDKRGSCALMHPHQR
jgi:hypothetical protein